MRGLNENRAIVADGRARWHACVRPSPVFAILLSFLAYRADAQDMSFDMSPVDQSQSQQKSSSDKLNVKQPQPDQMQMQAPLSLEAQELSQGSTTKESSSAGARKTYSKGSTTRGSLNTKVSNSGALPSAGDNDAGRLDSRASLTLTPLWKDRALQIGKLDPRLHQIAVKGPLALVPFNLPDSKGSQERVRSGVYVLDARSGAIRNTIRAPGNGLPNVVGVALDADNAIFAVNDAFDPGAGVAVEVNGIQKALRGLLVKAALDGTYVWLAGRIGKVRGVPVSADLDGDGIRDAAVVTTEPDEVSAWNGINGQLLFRSPISACASAQLFAVSQNKQTDLILSCEDALHLFKGAKGELSTIGLKEPFPTLDKPATFGGDKAVQIPKWQWPSLLGYVLLDAPNRESVCFIDSDGGPCRFERGTDVLQPMKGGRFAGSIVGGFFDSGRYGAITLQVDGEGAQVDAHAVTFTPDMQALSREVVAKGLSLEKVRTVAAGDFDRNRLWDLLVSTEDGYLRAYASSGQGVMYQREPLGGLLAAGLPSSTYTEIQVAGSEADEVSEFLAEQEYKKPHDAFVEFSPTWTAAKTAVGDDIYAAEMNGTNPKAPVVSWWLKGDTGSTVARPLLSDAQRNAYGLFAHDGVTLYALLEDGLRWQKVQLPPYSGAANGGTITGLAVNDNRVLLARGGVLIACDAGGGQCASLSVAAHGGRQVATLAEGLAPDCFWIGFKDGSIDRYAGGRLLHAHKASDAVPIIMKEFNVQGDPYLLTSNSDTTQVFSVSDGDSLSEPQLLSTSLDQVIHCLDDGPVYARRGGTLLESQSLRDGFFRTQGAPQGIRTIGCAADGGLRVLSLESGALALAGPPHFPRMAWGATALLIALGFVVRSWSARQRVKGEVDGRGDADAAKNVIVPEAPLARLSANRKEHQRLRHMVESLVTFIDNEDTRPPATLGIYGPWGSGKSSVMLALRHELLEKRRYISIWFNPWRFHRESDVAAALLQSVVMEVREQLGWGRLVVALRALGERRTLLTLSWMLPLAGVSCYFGGDAALRLMEALMSSDWSSAKVDMEAIGGTVLGGGTLGAAALRAGTKLVQVFGVSPSDLAKTQSPEKRVDFFRRFSDELQRVTDALPRKQEVVVFVDDLDRCPPEQVVAVLEALNMLAESQRVYLILGFDPLMVARGIELQRKEMLELMEKRGEKTSDFGARFLEKIVTLAVHVPVVTAEDVHQIATSDEKSDDSRGSWVLRIRDFMQSDPRALPLAWVILNVLPVAWLTLDLVVETFRAEVAQVSVQDPGNAAHLGAKSPDESSANKGTQSPNDLPRATNDLAQSGSKDAAAAVGQGAQSIAAKDVAAIKEVDDPWKEGVTSTLVRRSMSAKQASVALPKPSAPPNVSKDPPDALQQQGEHQNILQAMALLGVLLAISYVFVVLEVRRRQLRGIAPRARDSEEFADALQKYLKELPPNPRNVIRRANLVRLLYHMVRDPQGNPREVEPFFASLVVAERAERMRVRAVGIRTPDLDDLAMTEALLNRSLPPRNDSSDQGSAHALESIVSSFPPSRFETIPQDSLPAVHRLAMALQGWMHDTVT